MKTWNAEIVLAREKVDEIEGIWACLSLKGDDPKHSFAHFFFALVWNLMCWSKKVVDCHVEDIDLIDDVLGFLTKVQNR